MHVIGLTGGIASGKTLISNILAEFGLPIIDADIIAREVVKPGENAWLDIVNTFGRDILHDDGDLDRKKLGKIVFGDQEALDKLNNITHPAVLTKINKKIELLKKENKNQAVVVVVPLLFESGMDKIMDEVWVVDVEPEIQLKRLILRENLTLEEATQRINSQMPLAEKIARADKVINNSGDIDSTREAVIGLSKELMVK